MAIADNTTALEELLIQAQNLPERGGGGVSSSHVAVQFIDYDGTVVEEWGDTEVAAKTSLPNNPTHTGLVAQGWNWSLPVIQSYILSYPDAIVTVGQMYKTASGLTEIDITLTKVTGLDVTCRMVGNKDWGDGTTDDLTTHTYTDYGDYTITCDGTTIRAGTSTQGGMFDSNSGSRINYYCTSVRIGESVSSIGSYALPHSKSLSIITIPKEVVSIGNSALESCSSLISVCISDGVTSVGVNAFRNCYALTSISISNNITGIGLGTFIGCRSLCSVAIPDGVTTIEGNAFLDCHSLHTACLPNSVTSIGDAIFSGCHVLDSITISNGVASIGNSMFVGCQSLTGIIVPDSITSVGAKAFSGCISIILYDFSGASSVPVLESVDAFSSISGICKIIVPTTLCEGWKTGTNWVSYSDYIYPVGTGFYAKTIHKFALINEPRTYEFYWKSSTHGNPVVNVTAGSSGVISNLIIADESFSFDVTASVSGALSVEVDVAFTDGTTQTKTYDCVVYTEISDPSYSIEDISGAENTFALDLDSGYYVSQNYHVANSYSICRARFNASIYNMYIDCISYGESNFDYGILSTIDAPLTLSKTADTSNVYKSFKGSSSAIVQTVDYGAPGIGEHTIDIKYIKDSSGDSGDDTLKFKIRFE